MFKGLEELVKIIRERKNSSSDRSYTNKLLNDKKLSAEKVKEEIKELVEAVEKNTKNAQLLDDHAVWYTNFR